MAVWQQGKAGKYSKYSIHWTDIDFLSWAFYYMAKVCVCCWVLHSSNISMLHNVIDWLWMSNSYNPASKDLIYPFKHSRAELHLPSPPVGHSQSPSQNLGWDLSEQSYKLPLKIKHEYSVPFRTQKNNFTLINLCHCYFSPREWGQCTPAK